MKKGKIAVIGDIDVVQLFKAIGMDTFSVCSKEETEFKIKEIEKDYAVIYVTENYAIELTDLIKKYEKKAYPIIVPIPSVNSNSNYGLSKIKENVEKAVGINILD